MRKLLSRVCTFIVVISLVTMTACSQSQTPTQSEQSNAIGQMPNELQAKPYSLAVSFAAGAGTEDDPYQINTPEELALFASKVNSDSREDDSYASAHYVLASDIVLNDTGDFETWSEKAPEFGWEPIGNGTDQVHEFSGTFDGTGHVISGLYLCIEESGYNTYAALFGEINNAAIKNVSLEKALVRTFGQIGSCGGLVGYAYKSHVESCDVDAALMNQGGSISGTGGVVGNAMHTDIVSCASEGSVEAGEGPLGGIVGSFSVGTMSSCTNSSSVVATGHAVAGGVAGEVMDGGGADYSESAFEALPTIIKNCVNYGSVEYQGDDGTIFTGGICGSAVVSESSAVIDECENDGTVKAEAGTIGGVAGKAWVSEPLNAALASEDPSLTISNSKNTGELRALSSDRINLGAGGVAGSIQSSGSGAVSIISCENSGLVSSLDSVAGGVAASCLVQTSASLRIDSCTNVGSMGNRGGLNGGIVGLMQTCTAVEEARDNSDHLEEEASSAPLTPEELASVDVAKGSIVVKACNNTADLTIDKGTFGSGGIVGQLISPNETVSMPIDLVQCTNSGTFSLSSFSYCGGIVGNIASVASPIALRLCANEGDINALLPGDGEEEEMTVEQAAQTQWRLGGIVGVAPNVLTIIDRCTNTGSIEVVGVNKTALEGGEEFDRVRTDDMAATLY